MIRIGWSMLGIMIACCATALADDDRKFFAAMQQKLEQLEHLERRVQVLERFLTDEERGLARQFDSLERSA